MNGHGTHPPARIPTRVTFPPSVIVCPCGLHHMVRGQRIVRAHCEQLRTGWR